MKKENMDKKEDCINALYKAMSENPGKKISELFEIARKTEAPRFYTTFYRARRFVSMLDRGLYLPLMNENKKRMYEELLRRLKEKRGNKKGCYKLLEEIIASPAPEFYMDAETFRNVFYKTIRSKKRKK
jgi:hypothetical protein